jgi:hypothetical protein
VKPRFTLGQVVATPGALAAIGVSGDDLSIFLARHQSGDWGDIGAHDRKENQLSLEQGLRLMPVYTLGITGVKIWVITEAAVGTPSIAAGGLIRFLACTRRHGIDGRTKSTSRRNLRSKAGVWFAFRKLGCTF